MRLLPILMLAASAASAESRTVGFVPLEPVPRVLDAAQARDLDAQLRAAAGETLAGRDWSVVTEPGDADAVVSGRAAVMEGATVITLSLRLKDAASPAASVRVAGVTFAALRDAVRPQVQKLLGKGLALEGTAPEPPPLARGTLRIPGGTPAPVTKPAPSAAPVASTVPPNAEATVQLVREIVSDLEKLRGLRRKENLKVQILDDKLFVEALHAKAREELTPAAVASERARWMAFALAPPSADPAKIFVDVLDEQAAGFYDPATKALYVRATPPPSANADGPDGLRLILAHEIEHALQDQNFGFPDMKTLPDDDARLARLAVYEGDAMLAMTAYGAKRTGKPLKPAIASAAEALGTLDLDALLKVTGGSPSLAAAPAIVREELVAPYSAGLALVADAWQRGGFAFVDRVFRSPPRSTRELLHPNAYYAGEAQLSNVPPPAPQGTRAIATGRMGELATRVALSGCLDRSVARELAEKLASDAYTVAIAPDRTVSLVWTTRWTQDAEQAENALRMQAPCWEEQAGQGANANGWTISPAWQLQRDGAALALVRGLGDGAADAALKAALAQKPAQAAVTPALGAVPEKPKREPAHVDGTAFWSPHLGLSGELPQGYVATPETQGAALMITRKGSGSASLKYVGDSVPLQQRETFFEGAAAGLTGGLGKDAHLSYVGAEALMLAGEAAEERTWSVDGRDVRVHIALAPYCGGKSSLVYVTVENGDAPRAAFAGFAKSLKPLGKPRACEELE